MSSTSMDHLDELRVAMASSLPLNGLAPRTYARDHATLRPSPVNAASLRMLVDRLSSSRIPSRDRPGQSANARSSEQPVLACGRHDRQQASGRADRREYALRANRSRADHTM